MRSIEVKAVAFTCDVCYQPGEGSPRQKRHPNCVTERARQIRRGVIKANGIGTRQKRRLA